MIRYAITDGTAAMASKSMLEGIAQLAERHAIDRLQIREKALSSLALFDLTRNILAITRPHRIEVLVNERADIALAAGADGVHLTSLGLAPSTVRRLGIRLIGVSCHDERELQSAEREGADFAVLGPVFAPLSKLTEWLPLGLAQFGRLAKSTRVPVLALGGITMENSAACIEAGAAGIAGITLFQRLVS